ncbi:uncharacterized protein LOC109726735 [Ananas comosus]|uniref:Uncharacterized protein LOC109726735 n=1 Tax=Ananas comosus TaxID=4615 RepID=A0A6P5GTW5_ANACO|nr:uncharacterized protein LOC109726735 [Ananas comosus]
MQEKWERSNCLSLMLIKSRVSKSIRGSIPECNKAKDYLKTIKEQFVSSDKALASMVMKRLSGIKYSRAKGMHEHIIEIRNTVAQLKVLKVEISDTFLVHLILNSLPPEFDPFKISYNTHKDKWSINELLIICVQEEERLKQEKPKIITESVNLAT